MFPIPTAKVKREDATQTALCLGVARGISQRAAGGNGLWPRAPE